MSEQGQVLPGTLELLILKAVSLGLLHNYGGLLRIQQISGRRCSSSKAPCTPRQVL